MKEIGKLTNEIFEDHIPADDERNELSNRDIGVDVRASRCVWNSNTEFRITSSCYRMFY